MSQANPADILLFHKRRQAESAKGGKGATRKKRAAGLDVPMEPEDLAEVNIEDLVNENLVNNDKKLELLDEKSMGEALEQFVDKMESKAIANKAAKVLVENQKILKKRAKQGEEDGEAAVDNPTSVREFLSGITGRKRADYEMELEEEAEKKKSAKTDKSGSKSSTSRKKAANDDDSLSDSEEEERPTKKKSRVATTSKKKTVSKSRKKYEDSDDDFESEEEAPPPKKRATAKKTASKRKKEDSDSDIEFVGSTQSQATSKKTAARSARARAKKPKYTDDDSDAEEIDDDDSVIEETPRNARGGKKTQKSTGTAKARASSQTQSTMASFTSSRKPAASSRRGRNVQYLESDSDDEPSSNVGGGWGPASQSTKGRGRR